MGEICSAHKKQITAQLANSKHVACMQHVAPPHVLTLPVEKTE